MSLLQPSHSAWPADEREAVDRANLYRDHDPFPRKKAALLGSEDFLDYARVTGMIFPCDAFDKANNEPDRERIKPASYEVRPGDKFFRFDNNGKLLTVDLTDQQNNLIRLPANSISFVSTSEIFRLPNYIAMRFNLRIQHVHRGILLGTGPMVDPGFGKRILIPLHNLTDEDYYVQTSKGLIWVEFTKTSWKKPTSPVGPYAHNVPLPASTEKELRDYLAYASQGRPIRSSIPKAIIDAKSAAEAADKRASNLEQQVRAISIGGLVILVLTLAALLVPVVSMVQDTASLLRQSETGRQEALQRQRETEERLNRLCGRLLQQQKVPQGEKC